MLLDHECERALCRALCNAAPPDDRFNYPACAAPDCSCVDRKSLQARTVASATLALHARDAINTTVGPATMIGIILFLLGALAGLGFGLLI